MLLEGKQDKASKDTFFKIHLIFKILASKFRHQKLKTVTQGRGDWKKAKKVPRII
jgi:hypothetical protein